MKLTKPARVGNTVFRTGVKEAAVIGRAQREYEYVNKRGNPNQDPSIFAEFIILTHGEDFACKLMKALEDNL